LPDLELKENCWKADCVLRGVLKEFLKRIVSFSKVRIAQKFELEIKRFKTLKMSKIEPTKK